MSTEKLKLDVYEARVLTVVTEKERFKEVKQAPEDQNMSRHVYPDVPQVAVGALVIKESKVLLVKRKHPPGAGLWAIPGGSVELGETLQTAVEREVREETGLTIRARHPFYTFDVIERDDTGRIRFHYVIVDLMADFISGELNPDDDASDARWVAPEETEGLPLSPTTRDLLKKLSLGMQR